MESYFVDIVNEENCQGYGVFDLNTGFCKGLFTSENEAISYCNKLNLK